MAEVHKHQEMKVRQYHMNLLSQEELKKDILAYDRVNNLEVHPVDADENGRKDVIFHIHLKA